MNFYHYTTNWLKGELFEALLILLFGAATVIAGLLFGKLGTTPGAKALFWPLISACIIYFAIGLSMRISNTNRLSTYAASFERDKTAFIAGEKKRVEDFQYGYTISKIVASICFPLALIAFWFTKNTTLQGIGIGIAYFALAGLIVDYFSSERANLYYQSINNALQ